jgi:hypothetical protein
VDYHPIWCAIGSVNLKFSAAQHRKAKFYFANFLPTKLGSPLTNKSGLHGLTKILPGTSLEICKQKITKILRDHLRPTWRLEFKSAPGLDATIRNRRSYAYAALGGMVPSWHRPQID